MERSATMSFEQENCHLSLQIKKLSFFFNLPRKEKRDVFLSERNES